VVDVEERRLQAVMTAAMRDITLPPDMAERVLCRRGVRHRRYVRTPVLVAVVAGVALVLVAITVGPTWRHSAVPAATATPSPVATATEAPTRVSVPFGKHQELTAFLPFAILASTDSPTGPLQSVAFLGEGLGPIPDGTELCTGFLIPGQSLAQIRQINCASWNDPEGPAGDVSGPDDIRTPTSITDGMTHAYGVLRAHVASAQILLATPEAINNAATPEGGTAEAVDRVDVQLLPVVQTSQAAWRFYTVTYPSKYNIAGMVGRNAEGQVLFDNPTKTYCGPDPKSGEVLPCPQH
jgi:hypothetical protein